MTTEDDTTTIRHTELHHAEWNGIQLEITYAPQWMPSDILDDDLAHLEIRSIGPERAPLPITETGYLSHFTAPSAIEAAGGPVAYVDIWLEIESKTPEWRQREQAARQYSLL